MSYLTEKLNVTVAGLRGPGVTGADREELEAFRDAAIDAAETATTKAGEAAASAAAAANTVNKPIWAGKVNGWPDAFFRRLDLSSQLLAGRKRWWQGSGTAFAGWSRVSNSDFKGGKALRRAAGYNTTTYSGPYIWLDEMDAAPGDTITVYLLIKDPAAGGGTVYSMAQFTSNNDTVANGGAIVMSNAAGNQGGIVADATPKWLRLSVTVPAGAQGVRIYPYNISGSTGFDVLACWAFKGGVSEGPDYPTQADNYFQVRDTEIEGRLAAIEVSAAPYIAYQNSRGDAEMLGDLTYSAKLLGFYEQMTAKTVFNVAQMRMWASNGSTAVEWKAFIRDTAAAFDPSAETAVASGSIAGGSFPTADTLYPLQMPSKITVPAGKFIFFLFRAADDTNMNMKRWAYDAGVTPARHGFPLGTANGWNQTWALSGATVNFGQPAIKLLSVSDEARSLDTRVTAAEQTIASLVPGLKPFFTIPAVINAVVGTELNLYHDAILAAASDGLPGLKGYSVSIIGPKGLNKRRCFRFTPVSGDIGTHSFIATARDNAGNIVATRSFQIAVIAATPKGSAKNVLLLGDSLIGAGRIAVTAQAKFAALGAAVPTFVGSQGTAPAKHEGRGGKTFGFYAGSGGVAYRFPVTGAGTVGFGATYTVGGVTYTVTEVNISGGTGSILATGASAPSSSGTLTKASGTGDATLTYSGATTEPGNPLWNGGALNVTTYRSNQGISAVIDAVVIQLGINDVFGETLLTNFTAIINNAKAIATAFLADNPACKIIIELPTICGNTSDGFAANYGASQTRAIFEANIFSLRAAMLTAFDQGAYNANVKVGSAGLQVDRYYGYARSSVAVAARMSATNEEHNNGVHPGNEGYDQNGDAIFAEALAAL